MKRPANKLIHFLQERNETLALAESMTGGLAAHKLCGVKGACDVLLGSVVCYHEKVKTGLLGVQKSLIKKHTAESKEVTEALVRRLKKMIDANVYAAITGLAAPGGSETRQKPVGTVFFSIDYKNKVYNYRKLFRGSPIQVRNRACKALYDLLYEVVKN